MAFKKIFKTKLDYKKYKKPTILVIVGFCIIATFFLTKESLSYLGYIGSNEVSTIKGLVVHYTMDEKDYNSSTNRVGDNSSYENHGTNNGAIFTEDRFGKEGGAVSFDGINNNIDIGEDAVFSNDSWSLGLWFNTNSAETLQDLVSTTLNTNLRWFNLNQSKVALWDSSNASWYFGNTTISSGSWYHVFLLYDGSGNYKIYLNGSLDSAWPNLGTSDDLGAVRYIGMFTGGSRYFNGSIDDVRIYNRALSESEIQSLYDSYDSKTTTGSLQKGLVFDMPLKLKYTKDETSGSEIMTDRTPYSNDGQNYGAIIDNDSAVFNGSTNYIGEIDTNSPELFEPSSITVSSWIKLDASASTARHIWFTKWYGYSCEIEATSRIPYFRLYGPGDIRSNTPIIPGNWHHFVGTYDPSIGGRVYLDGELVGTKVPNGNITHSRSHPLNIGRYYGGIYFDGRISNAMIYNRALSDTEVKTLYDRGRSDAGIIFQAN
ncbi:MAG: LamG domain-containing protein [Patescibacteria group bacterium]|jgi:hypothetical protein|nr:LamG domain-containing protein [Patescibacteria group bacterium]